MPNPVEAATTYLEKLEADRQAALEISEQKAVEAKLIAARQEGFQAAMDILAGTIPVDCCKPQTKEPSLVRRASGTYKGQTEKPSLRRRRRDIGELIMRELTFSGEPMTARQIASAIDYQKERTETALRRLEHEGKVVMDENGRWVMAPLTSDRELAGVAVQVEPHHLRRAAG